MLGTGAILTYVGVLRRRSQRKQLTYLKRIVGEAPPLVSITANQFCQVFSVLQYGRHLPRPIPAEECTEYRLLGFAKLLRNGGSVGQTDIKIPTSRVRESIGQ